MATFILSSHAFVSPHSFLVHFNSRGFLSCFCEVNQGKKGNLVSLKLNLVRGLEFREKSTRKFWWPCCCKKGWENEGDFALEAEILEFMRNSERPEIFPSKKDLVDAGRMDLVERIKRQSGWLVMGWDLDDYKDKGFQEIENLNDSVNDWGFVVKDIEWDEDSIQERVHSEVQNTGISSLAVNSSCLPSSSGRPLEEAAEDDHGIGGILSRLEKERNMNFGFGFGEKGNNNCSQSNDNEEEFPFQASTDVTAGCPSGRKLVSSSESSDIVNETRFEFGNYQSHSGTDDVKNPTWREWSLQRAGFSGKEFEGDETVRIRNNFNEADRRKELQASEKESNNNKIQSRLENLKLELSSVLQSLKSNVDEVSTLEGDGSSSGDLHKLSDASEFQENEIMKAQDKLRSIRAKLVVLEGKMALAIIDAQKTVEEKQKRIDDTRSALQLLHTACIVWLNSGSEVLLAGSFDGWSTKRKMQKSSNGVFSVSLKLYPGKYEIKFIVDGEWKIDPLRPIVNNNGHENNLIIIT